MSGSLRRFGSAVLEVLLPTVSADACTTSYCQQSGSQRRCCKYCPGTGTVCLPYITGSCTNYKCPN